MSRPVNNGYRKRIRAYENKGGVVSLSGDAGVVATTAAGVLAWPATVVSATGLTMELNANYMRKQNKEAGINVAKEIVSQAGTQVANKKTNSNYIKATYEAAASLIKRLF